MILTAGQLTVMDRALVAVWPPPTTWTVKPNVPPAVGVPLRVPVPVRVSPFGSEPSAKLQPDEPCPPEAIKVWA